MTQDSRMVPGETQSSRRVKYGLNVAVSVAAVVVIAVLINWIAYRRFVRFDLTATRQYSLSPQTLNVLESLKGRVRCVALFSQAGPYIDQASDLLDEYKRYGRNLIVEHIDPERELTRMEAFLGSLRSRHEEKLVPLDKAIASAREAATRTGHAAAQLLAPLRLILEDPALAEDQLKAFTQSVAQAFARLDGDVAAVDKQIARGLDQPLPAYAQAKDAIETLLTNLDEKVFSLAIDRFRQAADADATPDSVSDHLLAVVQKLAGIRQEVRAAATLLHETQTVEAYDKLVGQLSNPDTLVLLGTDQVRVIGLAEMFREPEESQSQSGQRPQLRFQGEEKITGALVSMSMEQQPLVVFVTTGAVQALGPRGIFEQVAQRLRNVDFQLQQWNPQGQTGPMGQPIPAGPMPTPAPGQKAVWIGLSVDSPNPMNPMASIGGQKVADILKERIEAGDSAMVMLSLSPMARFGTDDPLGKLLEPWGITPMLDRIILRQIVLPNHQTRAVTQLDIDQWPDDLLVTRALAGMPGVFVQASPLELGQAPDTQVWPLVQVAGQDIWTHRDLQTDQNPKLDPTTAGGPFVIAAAAQRNNNRLVVVGDPAWATDQITQLGPQGLPAEIFGAAFPGNAELFVNSVYWLAGMEQLIAASPRAQDIRRVGPMTSAGMLALRWGLLAGMPGATVALGVGVWLVRRRG